MFENQPSTRLTLFFYVKLPLKQLFGKHMFFLPYLTKIEFQKFWLVIKFNPFLIKRILSQPETLPSLLVSLCATLHLKKFINFCKIVLLFLPFLFFYFISFNFRVFYRYLNLLLGLQYFFETLVRINNKS